MVTEKICHCLSLGKLYGITNQWAEEGKGKTVKELKGGGGERLEMPRNVQSAMINDSFDNKIYYQVMQIIIFI